MTSFSKPQPPRFLRVLLIGSWRSGKSHVMHTFPGLAVVDSQNGESSHFVERADRGEFPPFVSADVATFEEAIDLTKAIIAGKLPGEIKTIGYDSLTPLHNEVVARFSSVTQNGNERTDYVAVKRRERYFGDLIRTIPMHVVATAEPRDVRAKAGQKVNGKLVGAYDVVTEKESANYDDSIGHKFDYIFKMRRDGDDSIATCLKAKDETKIKVGEEIRNLTFDVLAKRVLNYRQPKPDEAEPISPEEIAAIESIAAEVQIPNSAFVDRVKFVSNGRTVVLRELNKGEGRKLYRSVKHWPEQNQGAA